MPSEEELTEANISKLVLVGEVRDGSAASALLRLMNGIFVPSIVSNESWPDTVRKEFVSHVNKFMSTFTEVIYQGRGKTVLYMPKVRQSVPARLSRPRPCACSAAMQPASSSPPR